MPRDFAFV